MNVSLNTRLICDMFHWVNSACSLFSSATRSEAVVRISVGWNRIRGCSDNLQHTEFTCTVSLDVDIIDLFQPLQALEIIPRQLCDNAGFDATNILNKLRQGHASGNKW